LEDIILSLKENEEYKGKVEESLVSADVCLEEIERNIEKVKTFLNSADSHLEKSADSSVWKDFFGTFLKDLDFSPHHHLVLPWLLQQRIFEPLGDDQVESQVKWYATNAKDHQPLMDNLDKINQKNMLGFKHAEQREYCLEGGFAILLSALIDQKVINLDNKGNIQKMGPWYKKTK